MFLLCDLVILFLIMFFKRNKIYIDVKICVEKDSSNFIYNIYKFKIIK